METKFERSGQVLDGCSAGDVAVHNAACATCNALDSKGSGDNPAVVLLAMLGNAPPPTVVINEMTTVASTWTNAQLLDGGRVPNNQLQARVIISIHLFKKVML